MSMVSTRDLEILFGIFDLKHPGVVLRPGFLRTAAIVDGLGEETKEDELNGIFSAFGEVRSVVLDREGYSGERVGLVVFPDAGACSDAITLPPSADYRSISSAVGLSRDLLIEAVCWPRKRRGENKFCNARNLIGLLFTVAPDVAEDPTFIERSVFLKEVTPLTTSADLMKRCFALEVDVAVLVRDSETSERTGLVVFANAGDVCVATNLTPSPAMYRRCVPAHSVHHTLQTVLEAADDHQRRRGNADTLRSLIPPQYLKSDASMDFHLRCLYLRSSRAIDPSQGVYNLCCIAEKLLSVRGKVCAAVVSEALDAAVLVFDDSQSTDKVGSAVSCLPAGSVAVYDSSLFPLPDREIAGGSDQLPLRGMLPELFTQPEYLGRVVVLRGIDAEECDPREIAYHIAGFGLKMEALYVHRAEGHVFAVFGSRRDAGLLRRRRPPFWARICGWPIQPELLDEAYFRPAVRAPAPEQEQELVAPPYPGVSPEAIKLVKGVVGLSIRNSMEDDTVMIAEGLVRLAALSRPDVLRHKYFLHRAVLLMGIHADTRHPDLCSGLGSTFGEIHVLALHSETGVALAVFRSWMAAAKLLRQPAENWRSFGFVDCRPVPGAVDVARLVDGLSDMVFSFGETRGRVMRYLEGRSGSETAPGG